MAASPHFSWRCGHVQATGAVHGAAADFTQWDHLQRDQQADADAMALLAGEEAPYGTFDYADESAAAAQLGTRTEVFPEPRASRPDLLTGTNLVDLLEQWADGNPPAAQSAIYLPAVSR